MSDRYKVLKTIEHEEWLMYCPIKIEKVQLLLDTEKNKMIFRLKMFNLSSKNIRTVYLNAELLDDALDFISSKQDILYLDLDISPKSNFGEKNLIYLNELNISYVKISITKVVFTDNNVWRNENNDIGVILPSQNKISTKDEFYSQIKREFQTIDKSPLYLYESYPTYWRCNCGQANPIDYANCCYCSIEREWLEEHLNRAYLEKENEAYNEFLINLKKEEDDALKNELEIKRKEEAIKKANRKKHLRIFTISGIGVFSLALLIFVGINIYSSESLAKLTHEENKSKIERVLKLGKNINEVDKNTQTALSMAVSDSNEEMFEFLLKKGADVTVPNLEGGKSAVDLAFENKNYELLSKMTSYRKITDTTTLVSKDNLLHEAVKNNDYEMVKFLIDRNLDVNTINFESKKPLEIAISNGYDDIKNLLLEKHAQATISENKSITVCESYGAGDSIYIKGRSSTTVKDAKIDTSYYRDSISVSIYLGKYKYEGDFKDNSITGLGKLYDAESMKLIYQGEWKNGLFEGEGNLYWSNYNKIYVTGTFKNGNPIEYTRYYQDGTINDIGTVDDNGVMNSNKYGVYSR
ncbi:ankyrin repeat domain-containing protein [uncultured Clostridium sp.]|uniref:ankyrin repeat domain-containing protein n=1 Tax=uncultured Clostridium sp. TaxID=59620 RepID=UPI002587DA46|nr:ankyrin repeat domain-containing protein [uncultured Clostridium sp.]